MVWTDDVSLTHENGRLRHENRILKDARGILKKPRHSAPAKSREVQVYRRAPTRMFHRTPVQGHGYQPTWLTGVPRPPSTPKAAIRYGYFGSSQSTFSLSLGRYGRPRMTEVLKESGLKVGCCHVGRLMRQNGISIVRTRKHKGTTDSDRKFNIAPNLLIGSSQQTSSTSNGRAKSAMFGHLKGDCIWRASIVFGAIPNKGSRLWTCTRVVSSAGQCVNR